MAMPEKPDKQGKITEAGKPIVVKPGEPTVVVTSWLGGEPEEVASVLAGTEKHKQLTAEYALVDVIRNTWVNLNSFDFGFAGVGKLLRPGPAFA